MRPEVLLFYKPKRAWIIHLRTSPWQIQASSIDHNCWQVNTERTPDPKSRSSHAYHRIPLRKAYHTPITHLQLISHKSRVTSHTLHRPEDRCRVTHHVLGFVDPYWARLPCRSRAWKNLVSGGDLDAINVVEHLGKAGLREACYGWQNWSVVLQWRT